ncbi:MAG: TolC family protein [Chitinophagaceae bacterium]|nr:TolC family protein [Chitinophagaceae bacterium]
MRQVIIIFFTLLSFPVWAQEKTDYSLKDCIDFALLNQPKMKGALLDEQMQVAKNKEVLGLTRPQVNASGQFQYLFIVPKSRIDADAFDFGSSLSFFKIDTPAYQAFQAQPKKKYQEAQFGLPLNASLGVTATQILFDAGVLVALQARASLEELTRINTQRTAEDVRLAVSKAYYNCQLADKRMSLLDENIKLIEGLENMTTKLFKEGFAERIDADRLTVQKNNLLTEKTKIQNLVELGYALLKFQMGMDLNKPMTLTEKIGIDEVKANLDIDKVPDYNNRTEMSLLKTIKQLNEYDYRRHQKSYLPTVAAALSGSYGTQVISFKDLFTYSYFPTGAFVLSASMPLYTGGSRQAKMQQARLSIMKNENDMQAFQQAVNLETDNARTQLRNSFISLDNQKNNIELAQKVYDIAQKKYKEGLGSNIEILQAETALKEAQINFYNTLFEAMLAKIDYQKAQGQLK